MNTKDATEASDARYQARIRELITELAKHEHKQIRKDLACKQCRPDSDILKDGFLCSYHQALSTPTPDTALQRKVLEARIDERLKYCEFPNGLHEAIRIDELRAQLAELGE